MTEDLIFQKIITGFNIPENKKQPAQPRKTLSPGCNMMLDMLSFAMAAIAMYPLSTGAKIAAEWFCNTTGIKDEMSVRIQLTVATFAVLGNALFCGYYAKNKIKQTSEAFWNKEFCPTPEALIALLFSMAASIMNAAIAEQSGNGRVFTFFSFIMATAMRLLAFEAFINEGKRIYKNLRYPRAPKTQQANLCNLLDRLNTDLNLMNKTHLISLEKITKMSVPSIASNRSALFTLNANIRPLEPSSAKVVSAFEVA